MTKLAPTVTSSGDRLQWLETFVRIVEAGSLSGAALQMNATQPTISRRLQALERSMGVRLLHRSTHAMRLTLDGERCFERARELLDNWAQFETDLRGAQHEPEGLLRVAVPHAFGQEKFVVPLATFLRRYPRVSVEWLLQDDVRLAFANGADCALQVSEPTDPAVVAIKVSDVARFVVAAPDLLQGMARLPRTPAELTTLPWLALQHYYRNEVTLTHVTTGQQERVTIRPVVSTDSLYALRSAAVLGLGACVGSAWLLADDIEQGRLVQVAPQWQAAPLPVFISYPYARYYPSRLQQFVAFMREAVPQAIGGLP
ncbi:MAG: LysR family transcriptional regulator [Comamonadaceae bacterium]|nr:MAG: LysR family transcriptional regulator [Comamonadaceae bacterium]